MYAKDNLPSDVNKIYKTSMYYKGITLVNTKNVVMTIDETWNETYKIKYFDENGICRISSLDEIIRKNISLTRIKIYTVNEKRAYCYLNSWDEPIFTPIKVSRNGILDRMLYHRMKPGDSADKLVELAKTVYIKQYGGYADYSEFDRLFQKINKPIFDGNDKYFNFIRVFVGCSSNITKEDVIRYKKEITNLVLETLVKNRAFQKYNVPVEILRLSNLTLTKDKQLEFIFEIKPEIRKLFEE